MNKAFRNTLRDIFGDGALIIFMVVVPIVYPLVYALIYNPETVHEVPVAVVDCAGNATSRDFFDPSRCFARRAHCGSPPVARSGQGRCGPTRGLRRGIHPRRFLAQFGADATIARERLLRHERHALL